MTILELCDMMLQVVMMGEHMMCGIVRELWNYQGGCVFSLLVRCSLFRYLNSAPCHRYTSIHEDVIVGLYQYQQRIAQQF
jgi:hypothetical protein